MTTLLLALTLAAPVPKDFQKPVPTLDGEWLFVRLEFNGQPINGEKGVWEIAGDKLTFRKSDGGKSQVNPIKTNQKASPRQFEFGDGGMLGVYEIVGDTLVVCLSQVGVRPTDTRGGKDILRYTLSRVKPAK